VLDSLTRAAPPGRVVIEYPLEETLFPPDVSSPCFRWQDSAPEADRWLITVEFPDGQGRLNEFAGRGGFQTRPYEWRPEPRIWEQIKSRSQAGPAVVTIVGLHHQRPAEPLSVGHVTIQTSTDPVGAPLFYREVNLPFVDAVKDPSTIRWRFGTISSVEPPPVVLEKLPVCGNCHSFSADGLLLGMDIDYANDKGSYAIAPVSQSMTLDDNAIITWSDYKRDEREPTFGLLSQVSPDGRYVVSTVKDESVFVPKPGLDFSQLFFPVKGILCIYDRQKRTFQALPGADDPKLVQSNPVWSPDGKYLVFAATGAYKIRRPGEQRKVLLSPADCREFLVDGKPFQFDLYRIPFNEGRGGQAEPLVGASRNGKSNYFARYSPDGKWIVFCQARNYMLLQPDSELYIIPAAGGEPRRLRANTKRMNSWHSFSPNSKWLVFSGKPDSAYTRLYLTHIDEQGESTPPVVLDRLTACDRAANIPEFVNAAPAAIRQIHKQFIDDVSYVRAATECLRLGDFEGAQRQAEKALALNPKSSEALHGLGLALLGRAQFEEAIRYLSEAAHMKPSDDQIEVTLGGAFLITNRAEEGVRHLRTALELNPDNAGAYFALGVAAARRGDKQEAIQCWSRAAELQPENAEAHRNLALALQEQGNLDQAVAHYRRVAALRPDDSMTLAQLGVALCATGATQEGLTQLTQAVSLDTTNNAIRYQLATTLARLKQYDEAIAQFLQILRRDPRHLDTLLGLATCYAEIRQTDNALGCLMQALQIAKSTGNQRLTEQIVQRIERYRRSRPAGKNDR
jgi:tetratricopeptide (TPR) repeat protein